MDKNNKVFVAGHTGLVGSALIRKLTEKGYTSLVTRTHHELDLTNQPAVEEFFAREKPEYVFLAAARVGGIFANKTYPAEFIFSNLQVQMNVIQASWKSGVKKLEFLGSSCIYPKFAEQPIREDALLSGKLEPTNEAYAVAKIAGIIICQSYNKQYGTDYISVMPTNLYGPGDNYHPMNSHVLPALIRRFHEAKEAGLDKVIIWGTGKPTREFLYSDDLADACIFLMNNHTGSEIVNIGSGTEVTIAELARHVKDAVGFRGEIVFDPSQPDGTPRKFLDCSRLHAMGWRHSTGLDKGIKLAYDDFLAMRTDPRHAHRF
ncbi:MAG: GDP-L-fucose synthase [Chitinispirillaceae bacterium]|nr:GDP-L-fucose synthase [Chitinispirillaceae bacterium]